MAKTFKGQIGNKICLSHVSKTWVMVTSKSVWAQPLLNQSICGCKKNLAGKISVLMVRVPDNSKSKILD